jgi:hypothetical protein
MLSPFSSFCREMKAYVSIIIIFMACYTPPIWKGILSFIFSYSLEELLQLKRYGICFKGCQCKIESLRVCIMREFYKAFTSWGNLMLSVVSSDKACTVYAHMLTNSYALCSKLSL